MGIGLIPILRDVSDDLGDAVARQCIDDSIMRFPLLQIGHLERFNAGIMALAERIDRPRYVEAQRMGGFVERATDVDVVSDLMIHDIDIILSLMGSELREISAVGTPVLTEHVDIASARLEFANGAVASLTTSRVAMKPMRRMRVFSKEGYASIDFTDARGIEIRKGVGWDLAKLDVDAVDTSKIEDLWKYVFDGLLSVEQYEAGAANPLQEELAEYVGAVRGGRPPRVGGREGLRAVEVAHRVLESIRSHPW